MGRYQIIVGNVGTAYDGDNRAEAEGHYRDWVTISKCRNYSRASGEEVNFMADGEPSKEYHPAQVQKPLAKAEPTLESLEARIQALEDRVSRLVE